MKKIIITALILVLVATLIFAYFSYQKTITGFTIKDKYSFTKAICDETNYCQDYIISCENKKIESITPISGAAIQHSQDWKDPRDNEQIEKLCD